MIEKEHGNTEHREAWMRSRQVQDRWAGTAHLPAGGTSDGWHGHRLGVPGCGYEQGLKPTWADLSPGRF